MSKPADKAVKSAPVEAHTAANATIALDDHDSHDAPKVLLVGCIPPTIKTSARCIFGLVSPCS